ncbi:MAG: hypothetical protein Q9217_005228 [Psora testacea]
MAAPPRVTIAKPNRPNGVLSVPASATQRKPSHPSDKNTSTSSARLKLIVRRLPPGLAEVEFEEALGDDWKVGGGKVAWKSYKSGKISKDPAKPSRPCRAYIQLTKQEHINALSEKVRNTSFVDAKGSTKDSSLIGPPSVEFAPYGRVPNGRPRKDARQGTIDQDLEFIDFLESLTNPVAKPTAVDQENEGVRSKEKVTVTPLVQFLKDKKSNKGKESAAAKNIKHNRHDREGKATDSKTTVQTLPSPKKRSAQAAKVEQAARDAVKVINKQAANAKGTPSGPPASKPQNTTPNVVPNNTANAALANKQRERGNVSAAAKIVQRDLGIVGNQRGRGGRHGTPNTVGRAVSGNSQAASKQNTGAILSANTTTTATASVTCSISSPPTTVQPPTGPAATRTPERQPAGNQTAQAAISRPPPTPSTTTQAFLKHANPSQGVTEALLEEAFKGFGAIKKVEIDKKKGFAYVDFMESESLQKAIKGSPIKVAQGQVQVLERKTGPTLQGRNNVRGGSAMMGNNSAGRGNAILGNNNTRGGASMASNHHVRGGSPLIGNRGGMAMGGRGGSMRGRSGMGRGGSNIHHQSHPKNMPASSVPSTTTATALAAPAAESQAVAAAAPSNPEPSEPSGT